jgi:sialate O-acetylesterase
MNAARKSTFLSILAVLALLHSAPGEVRLPGFFTDNMVLQRGTAVAIWGWASDGESVKVTFRGKSETATAKGGKWRVTFGHLKAGGPDTLLVEGRNRIELHNVLVGEVWICSGQSNMEWPMSQSFNPADDIAYSANPHLRLCIVPKTKANDPRDDAKAPWKQCDSNSVPPFSAVAYYFGRNLQRALNVPVGLIETCWGGSPAEVWMSKPALESNPEYKRDILDTYEAAVKKANDSGTRQNLPWKPTELYNGMIAPLIPFAFKGAIWYQGESNAGRAHQYRTLFPDMIRNWRKDWGIGNFTFLAVQLAPFKAIRPEPGDSDWAELREAQWLATQVLPKVGLAVITDVGEEKDIHPKRKEPVGERLAIAAQAIAYGEDCASSGPTYRPGSIKIKGDQAWLKFDHVSAGLEARGGDPRGFAICGADKKFVWADATIYDDEVAVSSPQVDHPVAVRFGWADYPVVNFWNLDGLPGCPFRTDDFPMITAPKK